MKEPSGRHRQATAGSAKRRHGLGHGQAGSRRNGFGGADEDFARGRKFSSEDLELLLVALLRDERRHGYELMKILDTRSNGFYTPSPGMIYPALTHLEKIGYASVVVAANRKSYALTGAGKIFLEANRERVELIWAKLNFLAKKMGLVRNALAGHGDTDRLGRHPLPALMAAFIKLKTVMFDKVQVSPAEQLRIAQVLERASAEIAAGEIQ